MTQWEGKNLTEIDDDTARAVCDTLRNKLVESVAETGGHLASNLGVVELTVALHRVFDFEKDRLVFDVGHQCYPHKMLTGRMDQMHTLRMYGGISGFPKPAESVCDAFIAGHASNSVSVALGMARARTLLGQDYRVVALIGDGALTGGLAYEGLSNAGASGEKLLVVLNDNGMSIRKNVGGMARLLERQHLKPQYLRLKEGYRRAMHRIPGGAGVYRVTSRLKKQIKGTLLPSTFFEDMGFHYIGPVDGHNVAELTRLLRWVDTHQDGPCLLHVRTVKGKGYPPAERRPDLFHGVAPFDPATGRVAQPATPDFSAVFGETLCALAREDPRICAVTAAMQAGTGLETFGVQYPKRLFDVGIAEGHAVTMCAGMAKQGLLPVFAVYSSFLQRSYDMLVHDVALQGLHVVFCVDRAGLVGADGETHQGIFDLAFLSTIPGFTVLAPSSFDELRTMLRQALYEYTGPVAVRYPRGGESGFSENCAQKPDCLLRKGTDFTLAGYGNMIPELLDAAELLEKAHLSVDVVKLNRLVPVAPEEVISSVEKTGRLLVAEETTAVNSVGRALAACLAQRGVQVKTLLQLNCGSTFIPHGTVAQLREHLGIDAAGIARRVKEALQ